MDLFQRFGHERVGAMLLDWVNSLDIASCTLVDDIKDLKSGCVVADIICYIQNHQLQGIQRNIKSLSQALSNWSTILRYLKSFNTPDLSFNPQDYLENDQRLLELLYYLSTLAKEPEYKNSFTATKASENSNLNSHSAKRSSLPPSIQSRLIEATPKKPEIKERQNKTPTKDSLKNWLKDLKIVKTDEISQNNEQVTLEETLYACRTGVLYADLINKLEGKREVIRGVERNPKTRAQALGNINKVLDYLKRQPRMNHKYLWSGKEIIEGEESAIWGLLEDLSVFYTPIWRTDSPFRAPRPPSSTSTVRRPESSLSFIKSKAHSLRSSPSVRRSQASSSSAFRSPAKSPRSTTHFYISQELKSSIITWVTALGVSYQPNSNPYLNTFTNGVLICELTRILLNEPLKFYLSPSTSLEITENFVNALRNLQRARPELKESVLYTPEQMAESSEYVFAFLYSLMKVFSKAIPFEYMEHPLPYGAVGIKQLELAIVEWVASLNILRPDPQNFQEMIPEIKTGVLLCAVVSRAFALRLPGIIREPRTDQAAMSNIRKALNVLKDMQSMSQKYVWSFKEILKGSSGVILGLFEDIYRCADGFPARKLGDAYYSDGPYLGKQRLLVKSQPESYGYIENSGYLGKNCIEIAPVIRWMQGLGIEIPAGISLSEEKLPVFSNGVILCKIVNSVENVSIKNIDLDPKTKFSALKNIKSALDIIRKDSRLPDDIKYCDQEVFEGNGQVIRKLLQILMKICREKSF